MKRQTPCGVERARELLNKPSKHAVYQAARRSEIPYRKVGKRLIFFEEELLAFLDMHPGVNIEDLKND